MPPRVRKSAGADDNVYYPGHPASRQKHFRAPRRRVVSQPPLSTGRQRKQITLTQIERGTPLHGATIQDSEDEFEEPRPKKRARRITALPGKTESQNTLTQIGWVSTIPPSDSDEDEDKSEASGQDDDEEVDAAESSRSNDARDEEAERESSRRSSAIPVSDDEFEGFSDGEDIRPVVEEEIEDAALDHPVHGAGEMHGSKDQGIRTLNKPSADSREPEEQPRTPRKVRRQEVPSSQSPPVTPLSAIHTHERRRLLRSPLQPLSANPHSVLDTPSRPKKSTPLSRNRSVRRRVAFQEQPTSSGPAMQSRCRGPSVIGDSEDEGETEDGEEDNVAEAVAGIDIGQETQAYIRRINFNCTSARATAEPNAAAPAEIAENNEDEEGEQGEEFLLERSANRSSNFDEGTTEVPGPRHNDPCHRGNKQPEPEPLSDATQRAIKQEPQTQDPWPTARDQTAAPQPTQHHTATSNYPPSPIRLSQTSPTQDTTCTHIPSSPAYDTYYTLPASQPTQLHLKQIILRPQVQTQLPSQSQTSTQDVTTQDVTTQDSHVEDQQRVPDSQGEVAPSSPAPVARKEGHRSGRAVRVVDGEMVVTATQLLSSDMADYSLPPPPPWSQTQTQDETDEDDG
ncbi:hypothetical protein B0J12DRAFT_737850 [Macrophomina phaseolina]|uniref:Uncharacterized protein n=1 Tax=Macrophomina phaseolina TaxID=35725 RepID=A0ABQ8GID2_9PEZI|nr:hypothetical protein B0J12DRAFT_737850 [Macrophomina phaseolina]